MKLLLALAVGTVLWLPSTAYSEQKAPCDLSRAPTLAQARVQATCVRASKLANSITNQFGVSTDTRVEADACEVRRRDLAVCEFTIKTGKAKGRSAMTCTGDVSVRGTSRYTRLLRVRLRAAPTCV
jgi:hypothetical protein